MRFLLLAFTVAACGLTWSAALRGESVEACGVAGPYEFDTLEAENYIADYAAAVSLVTQGSALTSTHTLASGDVIDVLYQGLERGPRGSRQPASTTYRVPPLIYKSILWIEANWTNAAGSVPYGGVGPILRSFDCGYGLGQITTGMSNQNGYPSGRQAIIGTHYLYNLAEGIRILADKWNGAANFRPIAGKGDPAALEDWYFAIWSYNGFAFQNHPFAFNDHPLNPMYDALRGGGESPLYHCYDPSAPGYQAVGGAVLYGYGDYTYAERVYGCMRFPPLKNGVRMWASQAFFMPDFTRPEVAAAFAPEHFLECQALGFSGGCAAMDFPTSWGDNPDTPKDDSRSVHADLTPLANPADAARFLRAPVLSVSGPATVSLVVQNSAVSGTAPLAVTNTGTGIGPFRVRATAPWLIVRHPGDPANRALDAGVAIGTDIDVVSKSNPRQAAPGYVSQLVITADPALVPPGQSTATLYIEPLLGGGKVYSVQVTVFRSGVPFKHRATAGGVVSSP